VALSKSRADWNFTLKVEINGDPFENLIYYYISQPFGWQPILPSASLSVLLGRAVHCGPVKTTSIVCPISPVNWPLYLLSFTLGGGKVGRWAKELLPSAEWVALWFPLSTSQPI